MLYVEHNYLEYEAAYSLRENILQRTEWERYDNPFERKNVFCAKGSLFAGRLFSEVCSARALAERVSGDRLSYDNTEHYDALFRYDVGDYLSIHLDAERHPVTNKKKAVTAILYLSTDNQVGSPLEFYSGPAPQLRTALVEPTFNTLVLFDGQWHGCPDPVLHGTRIVATISFMGQVIEEGRERAYFAPRPGEVWSKEKCDLRDLRADPFRYHEVYRV